MEKQKMENFVMTLPSDAKAALRRMAAEQNLSCTDQVTSAAEIARKIVLDHMTAKGILVTG